MDEIRFQAEVGNDQIIRLPHGLALPPGIVEVIVAPCSSRDGAEEGLKHEKNSAVWDWLVAIGGEAEQWPTELPSDMAENHDYYAHGTRRE